MRLAVWLLLAAAMLAPAPAVSQVRITDDSGGSINQYMSRYQGLRDSGERVVIDGLCFSACTLVLGIVPRERVCATRNAVLGFHAAWLPNGGGERMPIDSQTQRMMDVYPSGVRRWIARNGGLSSEMIYMFGRELNAAVRPCRATEIAGI